MPQDFSCTDLEFVRSQMNTMWADADYRKEVQPEVEVIKALKNFQSADLRMFDETSKKAKVKVYWVEACEGAVQDCTTDCAFTGANVSSGCKDYEVTQCKETILTIDDSAFFDNYVQFQQAVARGFLKHITILDNWLEQFVIAGLDGFAGANQYDNDTRATLDVAGNTFIDGPFWTPSLMSYFAKVKRVNHMPEAIFFSGENMYDHWWNAEKDAANANGQGAKNKFDAFGWFFDLVNMDTILGAEKTLMVSPHAAAFVSTNREASAVNNPNKDIQAKFPIASINIPGVTYDVYYRTECKNAGEDTIHHWRFVARYDLFQSPVPCSQTNTGILSFECGVAP